MGRPLLGAALGIFVLLIAATAWAADLAEPVEEGVPAAAPSMVELGTGWYLRGDVSFSRDNTPRISYDLVPLSHVSVNNSWAVGGGIGYRFNSWLRADWTFDYMNSINVSGQGVVFNPACAVVVNGCVVNYRSTQTRW